MANLILFLVGIFVVWTESIFWPFGVILMFWALLLEATKRRSVE